MGIITYFQAHPLVLAAVCSTLVGVCDLLVAINPNIDANGIFHAVYLFLKGKSATPPTSQS